MVKPAAGHRPLAYSPPEAVQTTGTVHNAANELARSLAKTKGAAFGWHRMTLAQLAANIASPALIDHGLASIRQLGAEATVARLLHRLRIEQRLGRFQPIAHTPGFSRAITAVLTEVRLAQLSSEDLATTAPDVSLLLSAYEAELAQLALADWPQILALATEAVLTHRLAGLPLLMLDVPIASEAELAFLRALASARSGNPCDGAGRRQTDARQDSVTTSIGRSRISTFRVPLFPTLLCGGSRATFSTKALLRQ